ncbi:GL23873 [Drosophila persimilis]|uniref:GL23873 n=1 Tax=Drosophila persimilis TaxID=7234 RepID=B4G6C5_DROPE|nr:GL23873 [Drosophila persimilis]
MALVLVTQMRKGAVRGYWLAAGSLSKCIMQMQKFVELRNRDDNDDGHRNSLN